MIPTAEGSMPYSMALPVDTATAKIPKISAAKEYGNYTLYEACMYKFIAIEGIVLDNYYCSAGYKTFGIGCVNDTPEENKLIKSGLTYEKVRTHLEKEFLRTMDLVERDAPRLYKKHEKAALAMLFLSIGYERFWKKNQSSWEGYKRGQGFPEWKWLRQCNYKSSKTGKYVRSEHIYGSKKFEVALFNGRNQEVGRMAERFKKDATYLQKKLKIWSAKKLSEVCYTPLWHSLAS